MQCNIISIVTKRKRKKIVLLSVYTFAKVYNLYYTFFYSYITYCNIVWGRAPTIYFSKIHILQKRIIRIMLDLETSHNFYLRDQIINIYQLNKYISCVLMYKHKRGMLQNIFYDMLTHHIMLHSYKMRQEITYKIPYCKTNTRQNIHWHMLVPNYGLLLLQRTTWMIVRLFIYLKSK